MKRTRVNGQKFEQEFWKAFDKTCYVLRLHTPNTGYSGLTQPADFLVIGENISLVELKETTKDVFYISQMEQLDEVLNYLQRKLESKGKAFKKSQYLIIVHFIHQGTLKVITAEYANELYKSKRGLTYKDENALGYATLKELKENLDL